MMPICSNATLIFLITCMISSMIMQVQSIPKKEVETVPGIIYPIYVGRVCMLRKDYVCRWSYEKSCSCNPVRQKDTRRVLDITYVRLKTKGKKKVPPIDVDKCDAGADKCIKF